MHLNVNKSDEDVNMDIYAYKVSETENRSILFTMLHLFTCIVKKLDNLITSTAHDLSKYTMKSYGIFTYIINVFEFTSHDLIQKSQV